MPYASVMVWVDPFEQKASASPFAAGLARSFGARLTGIAACERSPSLYFAAGAEAERLIAEDRDRLKVLITEAELRFRREVGGSAGEVAWRCAIDFPTSFVSRQARAADLLVALSRGDEPSGDPAVRLDAGPLVLQVGRPVLLVPPDTQSLHLERAMVAWKDAREARRAVVDAIPLLRRAAQVLVFECVESTGETGAARMRLADVAAWLRRHGIEATIQVPDPRRDVLSRIDELVAARLPDLIVSGAYGHSRLGEWVFGGVTHHLMQRSKCCLLLAH